MKILELINNGNGITNKEIANDLGLTVGHVMKETKKLYNKNLVDRVILKINNTCKYHPVKNVKTVDIVNINMINTENPWSTVKLLEYYKNNKIQFDLHA